MAGRRDLGLVRVVVGLPEVVLAEIDLIAGPMRRGEFIRELVREGLRGRGVSAGKLASARKSRVEVRGDEAVLLDAVVGHRRTHRDLERLLGWSSVKVDRVATALGMKGLIRYDAGVVVHVG